MYQAAQVMENPADLISAAIEILVKEHCGLPGFSTLERMARRICNLVNRGIYQSIASKLADAEQQALLSLIDREASSQFTAFNRIKEAPKSLFEKVRKPPADDLTFELEQEGSPETVEAAPPALLEQKNVPPLT